MEMPPYRLPKASTVALAVWESCKGFLRKVTTIILASTIILWVLLNVPVRGDDDLRGCQRGRTCSACGPLVPWPTSNSTF